MNRINVITLGVTDIKRSLVFFKTLGFATSKSEKDQLDIVWFKNQGSILALYPLDALAVDISLENPPKREKGFSGMTLAINVKHKDEVDALLHRAKEAGGEILKPAEQVFWGGYSGYFSDPDGYVFEVAYSEHFTFDKQGMIIQD